MVDLTDFYDHKLLINMTGVSKPDLIELDKIINQTFLFGDKLYDIKPEKWFLHSMKGYIFWSKENTYMDDPLPYMYWIELLENPITVEDKDLEEIYK